MRHLTRLLFAPALLGMLLSPGLLRGQVGAPGVRQTDVPPGEYVIDDITVNGAQFTSEETVILLSGLVIGDLITIPSRTIPDALRKLWRQDIFSDVSIGVESIDGNRIVLNITVRERARIVSYEIRGVGRGQQRQLRERINLVAGTIFTEAKQSAAERIIRNYYMEKGFLRSKIDFDVRLDTLINQAGLFVTIDIRRGPRVKVKDIIIADNSAYGDNRIRRKMKNVKKARPWAIFKRSKFVRSLYNEDKQAIVDFYNNNGYRDAEIVADSVVNLSARRVAVYMRVEEGNQYFFGDITWKGNLKYDDELLTSILNIEKGEVFSPELLMRRLQLDPNEQDVASLYLNDGYLFFRADPVETAIRNDTVDLEIRIFEGPQADVEDIILQGNEQTYDHVVLREMRTLPGQKFSRSALIRSQREIVNLGYFDPEVMDIAPQPDPQTGTVDIKFILSERSNDQITLQGGYGGVIRDQDGNRIAGGVIATVGLQFNNFSIRNLFNLRAWRPVPRGDGQKLTLQVQTNGTNFQNYSISFLEPWFGGRKPNSLGVSFYYSLQKTPFDPDFRLDVLGASIDLGRRLSWPDDYFRSYTTLSFRNYFVRNASIFPGFRNGNVNIISIKQAFDRTSIDAPIFTRSGSIFNVSMEATPPYSLFSNTDYSDPELTVAERFRWLEFYKVKVNTQAFMSLTNGKKPLVLMPRVQFGILGSYNPDYGQSPFERFYLGGDGLQGFNLDGREIIALRGYDQPGVIEPDNTEGGATSYVKYTLELRYPLLLEAQSTVWFHAFFEAGNSWTSLEEFNPFVVRRSAGVGLRAFLPMFGLLGIDYGYGFDPVFFRDQDISGGQVHFLLGQQF